MARHETDDLRIVEIKEVISPGDLQEAYPVSDSASDTVFDARQAIKGILRDRDDRVLVITGPCSIHDPSAAMEYARRLVEQRERFAGTLEIVMRVYFEKPRTIVGWKGLINDPHLDESFEINEGLHKARKLLLDINDLGLPVGTEYLDLMSPQYVADLIAWGAVGARTTESQGHRELTSGLSCPVGFKNGTNGGIKIAIDAIRAAGYPHVFMSQTKAGHSAIFRTSGNEDCHVILRGGKEPNYDAASVEATCHDLHAAGLPQKVMIDFSHANSRKDHDRQVLVCEDVSEQIAAGDDRIFGVMIESNLLAGRQDVVNGKAPNFGQSITDACVDWESTVPMLEQLAEAVERRRQRKAA